MINKKAKLFLRLVLKKKSKSKKTNSVPENDCKTSSKPIACTTKHMVSASTTKHMVSASELFSMVEEGHANIDQYSLIETILDNPEAFPVSEDITASDKMSWQLRTDMAYESYIKGRYYDAITQLISIKKDIKRAPKDASSMFVDANADFLIASIFDETDQLDIALPIYKRALSSYRDIIVVCAATEHMSSVKQAATEKVCLTLTRISDIYCLKSDWKATLKASEDALSVFSAVVNKRNHNREFLKLEERILDLIEDAEEILGLRKTQYFRKSGDPKIYSGADNAIAQSILWFGDTAGKFLNDNSDYWFQKIDALMSCPQ